MAALGASHPADLHHCARPMLLPIVQDTGAGDGWSASSYLGPPIFRTNQSILSQDIE
jgi:hypothetical protein